MRLSIVAVSVVCLLAGCGGSSTGNRTGAEEHLRNLGTYYSRFLAQHKGRTPGTVDELKAFMKKQGAPSEGFDALFISPRDGEPYSIALKVKLGPPRADGPIVLHEKTGKDGNRIVVLATGEVRTMDETAFKKALGEK